MLTSETNYLNHFHSLNPLNSSYSGSLLNNSSERGVQLSSTLVVVAIYFQNITYKLHLSKSRTPDQITQNTATSTQTNTVIGKKKTFSIFRNRFSFFSHLRGNNVSAGLSLHAVPPRYCLYADNLTVWKSSSQTGAGCERFLWELVGSWPTHHVPNGWSSMDGFKHTPLLGQERWHVGAPCLPQSVSSAFLR